MTPSLTLILGGARSGKSDYAQRLAADRGRPVIYLATAAPIASQFDSEMAERIAAHRQSRPADWQTVEEPIEIVDAITRRARPNDVVVVDCLTLWVSNVCLAAFGGEAEGEAETVSAERWRSLETAIISQTESLRSSAAAKRLALILISNEVGLGVVPAFPLGRHYRDLLGRVNQAVARNADHVILMLAGLPIDLRRIALTPSPFDQDKDLP